MDCVLRAALYIRVSTEEQASEGQSVAAQIDTLTQYCCLYNINIYDIYKDLGISGKETQNRPGLISMLQDAKHKRFNMVLVWKISRLSRNLKDLLLILDQLEKSNIVFSSYSEKFDTSTPVGKMTLQLLGSIAEFERNTIIDNVKLGLHEYANKGGKTGTVLGYDNHNKQLIINPAEAEIVTMIYKLYSIKQMSMSEIAVHLNELGYKTKRNNHFTKDGIAVILSNPVYIGINRHNIGQKDEYHTTGLHPHIVDAITWETAQSLRKSNKNKKSAIANKHCFLLSGKILCPNCSTPMRSFTSSAGSRRYRYYRCKSCSSICNADNIEKAVLEYLRKLLNKESIINDALLHTYQGRNHSMNDFDTKTLQKELNKTQMLLDRYVLLLKIDDFSSSAIIMDKIKELESKLNQYKSQLVNIKADQHRTTDLYTKEQYLNLINQLFEKQDTKVLKKIIDLAIHSIALSDQKKLKDIHLKFNIE
ncbi:MAG: hypothetical protein A2Y23_12895 [Clostridiales bacterium GWB2_37_7]|nr:MAG: hypothetical protein A2Y23_12895 [Clostridiales bacterium GWB2_37_7]